MKLSLKLIIGLVIVAGIFGSIIGFVAYKIEMRPTIETPESEIKTLPNLTLQNVVPQPHVTTLSATIRVPILMYHYVEIVKDKKDTIRQSLDVPPQTFEKQIETLKTNGYTFLTAKELGEILDGTASLPPKPILLTFDDGHWDLATDVLPILKKYQVKATAYIITGFLGKKDFMTPDQLFAVIDSGLVDIGAHTVNHVALKGKLYPLDQREIDQSKNTLAQKYGLKVVSFAYPNGSFDNQAINLVKQAGYTTAVSTIPGIDQSVINRFYLYRLRPGNRTGNNLLAFLERKTFKK